MKNEKSTNPDTTEEQKPDIPPIADKLIEAFATFYQPADPTDETMEAKSTLDIIEEMASVSDVEKYEIAIGLEKKGFKIIYTAVGAFWAVKPR